jgi:hypothetical protein
MTITPAAKGFIGAGIGARPNDDVRSRGRVGKEEASEFYTAILPQWNVFPTRPLV